jgi:hypothetical protein
VTLELVPPRDILVLWGLIQEMRLAEEAANISELDGLKSLDESATAECDKLGPLRELDQQDASQAFPVESYALVRCILRDNLMKDERRL